MDEDEWHEAIENDEIPYPDIEDWRTSLSLVKSVRTLNRIYADQIDFSGDAWLSQEDEQNIEKALHLIVDQESAAPKPSINPLPN